MTGKVKALIMVPPSGASRAERWLAEGRKAAAIDLIHVLNSIDLVDEIHILIGDVTDREVYHAYPVDSVSNSKADFRFADALLYFATKQDPEVLIYFGAGSAPLLSHRTIEEALNHVIRANSPMARVNNLHSTDWAIFNSPKMIGDFTQRLPTDNQLGWVMKNECGFQVEGLPFSAETRMDIDTPTDLLMLSLHPGLGRTLDGFLTTNTVGALDRINAIRNLLKESGKTLALIGRSSSSAWRALEAQTQIWVRLFVEERGMVASGRLSGGRVRSLFAEVVDSWGIEAAIESLASIADGVLWDTRVWMGHKKSWPKVADRYASDLGWIDEIEDRRLRELTDQVINAPIPITTGGHSTVSGGVIVLLDSIR